MSLLNLPLVHVAHELSVVVLPAVKPLVASHDEMVWSKHEALSSDALNVAPLVIRYIPPSPSLESVGHCLSFGQGFGPGSESHIENRHPWSVDTENTSQFSAALHLSAQALASIVSPSASTVPPSLKCQSQIPSPSKINLSVLVAHSTHFESADVVPCTYPLPAAHLVTVHGTQTCALSSDEK